MVFGQNLKNLLKRLLRCLAGWKIERQLATLHCTVLPSHDTDSAHKFIDNLRAACEVVKVTNSNFRIAYIIIAATFVYVFHTQVNSLLEIHILAPPPSHPHTLTPSHPHPLTEQPLPGEAGSGRCVWDGGSHSRQEHRQRVSGAVL